MGLNDGDSAVPAVNYGVIRSWINYWQKDLLEEPKEVLLGSEHLGNVVPEARSALEKWLQQRRKKNVQKNSKGDWELTLVRILGLLERAIKEDPVADLVALEYPNEMNDLRSLLSVKQIYEVGCIYPILQRIEGAPSLRTLKEVLLRELSKGERADQRLMGAVAVELARTGVGKFDSRELRGLLKSALADEGTALLLKEHLESIEADTRLEDQARGLWQEFLFKAANSEKVAEGTGADGGVLFDMFGGDLTWRSLTYWLLNDLRVLWVSALEQCRTSMDDGAFGASALVSMLKADEEALTQLGTKIVRRYAVNVFRQTFHYVRKEANEKPSASMEEAGRTFAEFVGKRGVFHDPKSPGEYQGVLRAASRTALQAAAIATELELSAVCADRYVAEDSGFVSGVASGIGYRMMEMLEDEVSSFKKTDSEGPTGKDTEVDGCSYEELESMLQLGGAK